MAGFLAHPPHARAVSDFEPRGRGKETVPCGPVRIRMVDERAFLGLCAEGFRLAGGKRDAAVGDRGPQASVHRALDEGRAMTVAARQRRPKRIGA